MPRRTRKHFRRLTPLRWLARGLGLVLLSICLFLLVYRSGSIPTTAFMLQQQFDRQQPEVRYQWVDLEDISPAMQRAVIAAEDGGFAHHHGIEWYATRAALTAALSGERAPGGSTITQQVAKNLFLWPGRSYLRKGIELLLAPLIEFFWSKRRILEVYLNIAQFSKQDYGVGTASRNLFKKTAKQLGRHDAARLAAVLPSPSRYSVARSSTYLRAQQRKILSNMQILETQGVLKSLD